MTFETTDFTDYTDFVDSYRKDNHPRLSYPCFESEKRNFSENIETSASGTGTFPSWSLSIGTRCPCPFVRVQEKSRRRPNSMYRNFNAVVGRPFRVALLRVQTVARLKPCPTYKKKAAEGLIQLIYEDKPQIKILNVNGTNAKQL